ncbi:MAG TPA: hypothetical protein PKN22_01170 [Taishania sp.]|nr:hypothetical protein [Taishania sp.]
MTFTITDPDALCGTYSSAISINFDCNLNPLLYQGITIRNVVVDAGQIIVNVLNDSPYDITGSIPITVLAIH